MTDRTDRGGAGAQQGTLLYLQRWLKHPLQMASILPASRALGRAVAAQVRRSADQHVVELGAGTGAVTQAILEGGIPPERLILVEIDPPLAEHLRARFPRVRIVEGDAFDLPHMLPEGVSGSVGTVVTGLPLLPLPSARQRAMVDAILAVLAPGGHFVQYTYSLKSPLPLESLGLIGQRTSFVLRNVPPASVWSFRRGARR